MANNFLNIPGAGGGAKTWKAPVADFASLPSSGNNPGDARITLDTFTMYVWTGSAWQEDTATDTNAIYRNDSQPPTQDIGWADHNIYSIGALQDDAKVNVVEVELRRLLDPNASIVLDFSGSSSRADAGQLRFSSGDSIQWRASNDADNITLTMLNYVAFGGNQFQGLILGANAMPAQSGMIRMPYGAAVNWRTSDNTQDLSLFSIGTGLILQNFESDTDFNVRGSSGASNYLYRGVAFDPIANSGQVRLQNTDSIAWRNSSNSGDLTFKVDSSNNFLFSFPDRDAVQITSGPYSSSTLTVLGSAAVLNAATLNLAQSNPPTSPGQVNLGYGNSINWGTSDALGTLSILAIYSGLYVQNTEGPTFFYVAGDLRASQSYTHGDIFASAATVGAVRLQNADKISWASGIAGPEKFLQLDSSDNFQFNSNLKISGYETLTQISTPSNPSSGSDSLYFKSDDNLYSLNSSGVETQISGLPGGANQSLSNLTSPTNVNQDLLSNTNQQIGNYGRNNNFGFLFLKNTGAVQIGFDNPTVWGQDVFSQTIGHAVAFGIDATGLFDTGSTHDYNLIRVQIDDTTDAHGRNLAGVNVNLGSGWPAVTAQGIISNVQMNTVTDSISFDNMRGVSSYYGSAIGSGGNFNAVYMGYAQSANFNTGAFFAAGNNTDSKHNYGLTSYAFTNTGSMTAGYFRLLDYQGNGTSSFFFPTSSRINSVIIADNDSTGADLANFLSAGTVAVKIDNIGNIRVATVGSGLNVAEGSNAKQGVATLVGGTATVSNTSVTANSRIMLTVQDPNGGTVGSVYVSARTASTSFTISSTNILDTSIVAYEIFEPA